MPYTMVNLLSILAAILAGHLIQPAAGQFNPHSALPIHATGRWGWNGTQSLRQMNVSFAAPRELLFQNEMAVWPVHTTILKNLLQDVVKGQMKLQKLVPPACNFFDASIVRRFPACLRDEWVRLVLTRPGRKSGTLWCTPRSPFTRRSPEPNTSRHETPSSRRANGRRC